MAESKSYSPTYRDELALAHHFVAVLEQRLAGRDSTRRTNVHPLDWCHLGVLGPSKGPREPVELEASSLEAEVNEDTPVQPGSASQSVTANVRPATTSAPQASEASESEREDEPRVSAEKTDERESTRRKPSAIGFEVLVEPDASGVIELAIDTRFCIFTKHLPTYEEQTTVLDSGASVGAPLAEVVQRWPLECNEICIRITNGNGTFYDNGVVQEALDRTLASAFDRFDAERHWDGQTRVKVGQDSLATKESFNSFVKSAVSGLPVERWELKGSIEVRAIQRPDGKIRVGCYFRNDTPETPPGTNGKGLKDAFKVISDVYLQAKLKAGVLKPIEILPVPQDYQYDRRVWAVGHNTSARTDHENGAVCTAALAVYEQPRVSTRDAVTARFSELANDPFATLDAIYEAMCTYARHWHEHVLGKNAFNLDSAALAECERDYRGFEDEIHRFACGVAAVKKDERLLEAFKAANRVFGRLATGYDSWRLFQLVYIVTQLPALAIRENHKHGEYPIGVKREWSDVLDWGDVLWFRTGGGKTEAYLGLACCAILYDRLRGKRFGMTAWLRFPLRMLSIQQLQRAMRVVWETEQERRKVLGEAANQSAPIRLGYFVGSKTTPNSLSPEFLKNLTNADSLEWVRVVPNCPACGGVGTVTVKVNTEEVRFRHVCSRCDAELPLDVSDDEVYRYLPTLVVGTIDKMATVGQQPKFGLLWGGAKWKCPKHGYSFGKYCSVYGCKPAKRLTVKPYDPAPALHIQDELHLLQEDLGAFSGHYETLVRFCEQEVGGLPSKIIAATATIEGFENQVRHLYGVRHARRFPGRGYDKLRSFYAEPERDKAGAAKTARIFVAFRSPSLSPADASALCTEIFHEEIGRLFANPHLALAFLKDGRTAEDLKALLRHYTTTLNYVASLPKGSRVRQVLEGVSSKIRPGARDLNVEFHSSRSSSAQVAEVVHRVENPPDWRDEEFLDALVATNMISHGVDLERVNLMTMDGVPEETAEYIQASSRSGRRHVGLVVVVLASFSLRASSIYHRFLEYHQHLDRMVSPVPVNRFAKYAAQRTLPGIVMGLLYGLHIAQTGNWELKKRAEVNKLFASLGPQFLDEVKAAYALGLGVYDPRLESALSALLQESLDVTRMSIANNNDKNVRDAIKPAPMTNLRDVESGVPFWPDQFDHRLLTFVQRSKN